ncbi:MAG: glycerol acyltransferase [Bacteroidetes bacterium]|nr:glycerol acyltransferase [Bacteroidota bacterium]
MNETQVFDGIRPYYDHEAYQVLQRIIKEPLFMKLINNLWPGMTMQEVLAKAEKVNSAMGFQIEFMHPAIRTIVERSSDGLTCNGFENLDKNQSYLFVANHRDILLDSALLQILLVEHGFDTSEITFGDNLMEKGFITDFGKLNRMFTVLREGTGRELYDISKNLSIYIRHTITDKKVSVWIAQRNGRAKDGNDQTQTGLLKMLNMSGDKSFSENFGQLRVVPLTISYEYEPCDTLKVQELYLSSLLSKYVKAEGEDMNSVITGITQQKGRIHLTVGTPIINELEDFKKINSENEKIKQLTALMDQRIYNGYKIWPVNYIASDILEKSTQHSNYYTLPEKQNFIDYVNARVSKMNGEKEVLFNLFMKIYSSPLKNKILQTVQV